jgi:hypothetical protein
LRTHTQAPDGFWTTNEDYLTGLFRKTSGARVYLLEYTFDHAGRLSTMTTGSNPAPAARWLGSQLASCPSHFFIGPKVVGYLTQW